MKILFLTQLFPYPPDNGGKIKSYRIIKVLKKIGHQITFVSFIDHKSHRQHIQKLAPYCSQTHVVLNPVITQNHRQLLPKAFFSLFTPKPFAVVKYYNRNMIHLLSQLISQQTYDLIYIDHLHLAQYLDLIRLPNKPLLIYDEHNITSLACWRNSQISTNLFYKLIYRLDAIKWYLYEKEYLNRFDHIFTISSHDQKLLIKRNRRLKNKISLLPIPFQTKNLFNSHIKTPHILFMGLMSWKPNADAFWWLVKQIMPQVIQKIPSAKLTVIGANPSPQMHQTARANNWLQVLGYVDYPQKYLRQSRVFVVPIRSGSGLRIKILTSLSHGLPTVTTTTGAEGLNLNHVCLISNHSPTTFANNIIQVLTQPQLAQTLSRKGLKYIHNHHNYQLSASAISQTLHQLTKN